ncbi:unnamed protein product [Trichobilharzia szidati]|nr:unnamed protein product [Trichobilharzia szidati]
MYSRRLFHLQFNILWILCLTINFYSLHGQNDSIVGEAEHIDNTTLYQILSVEKHVVVYFYEHTTKQKSIIKQFHDMVNKINESGLPVLAFTLCATYYEDVVEKLNIYSPSITYFYNGGQLKYEFKESKRINEHNTNLIYEWIKQKLASPIKLLRNLNEAKELVSNNKLISIIFMKDTSQEVLSNLSFVAQQVDYIAYGLVYNRTVHDHFNITDQKLLLIRKETNNAEIINLNYSENWDIESLGSFLLTESFPYVAEYHPTELTHFDSSKIRFIAYLFLLRCDPEFSRIIYNYQEACKLFRKKIRCNFVDNGEEVNSPFARQHGVHVGYGYPRFQLVVNSKSTSTLHYRLTGGNIEFGQKKFNDPGLTKIIEIEEIKIFFSRLLQDKLSPFYISELIPQDDIGIHDYENLAHIPSRNVPKASQNKLRFVHKIVGATFNKLVRNPEWTSVVYFTANWCIGCNRTIYEYFTKLAEHYYKLGRNDLLFGYSNYELNEYEGLKAKKMPRIKIFPRQSTEQIDFEGPETFHHIRKFIETVEVNSNSNEVSFEFVI